MNIVREGFLKKHRYDQLQPLIDAINSNYPCLGSEEVKAAVFEYTSSYAMSTFHNENEPFYDEESMTVTFTDNICSITLKLSDLQYIDEDDVLLLANIIDDNFGICPGIVAEIKLRES